MIRRLISVCAAISLLLSLGSFALAQGFGGSSAFRGSSSGSSGFGSSGFGGGFGSGGFGSSGFGSSGFGSSGFGGGFGSSGFGSSGFGGGFGNSGFGNSMSGNSGFGGGFGNSQYGGGQNFVGRDASDIANTFGQMGKAGTQYFNQMNRQMNRNNSSKRQTNKTIQNPAQPMRVEVRVAFDTPQLSSNQLATTVRTRLAKILAEHKMTQPVLTMEGDTAVISGVAASEHERDVIAGLVEIEPGVRDVRNEMTVATPATVPVAPAPGN
jgi:hypothetical protein